VKDSYDVHLNLLKTYADKYEKEAESLSVELNILREKTRIMDFEKIIKDKDEEITSLKNDLNLLR
jgi:hypothetical protein